MATEGMTLTEYEDIHETKEVFFMVSNILKEIRSIILF